MKKFFLILAVFVSAMSLQAASYGILVNDTVYFAGTPSGQYEGFDQYLAHVKVKAGDKLTTNTPLPVLRLTKTIMMLLLPAATTSTSS